MIRIYDDAGNVIETHEHTGEFKEWKRNFVRAVERPVCFVLGSSY